MYSGIVSRDNKLSERHATKSKGDIYYLSLYNMKNRRNDESGDLRFDTRAKHTVKIKIPTQLKIICKNSLIIIDSQNVTHEHFLNEKSTWLLLKTETLLLIFVAAC